MCDKDGTNARAPASRYEGNQEGSMVARTVSPDSQHWAECLFMGMAFAMPMVSSNALLLDASDTSHPQGRYGILTCETWTVFDDIIVIEP